MKDVWIFCPNYPPTQHIINLDEFIIVWRYKFSSICIVNTAFILV